MVRKRKVITKKEEKSVKEINHCVDCEYAFDPHEKGADGLFFLVKCKQYQLTGEERFRWSHFTDQVACDKFKKRNLRLDLDPNNDF